MKDTFLSKVAMGVCGAIGKLADVNAPQVILKPAIKAFSLGFGINQQEVAVPSGGFTSFGDFFARSLVEGARTIYSEDDALVSPCDGALAAIQHIPADNSDIFRVKGFDYSIDQLLGESCNGRYADGKGMVIYLHPRDYHRVHMPVDAQLLQVRHIAGARFPVAPWAEERVSGIYQRNERMVFQFRFNDGYLSLVMVAAFGVGNIVTPHAPPRGEHTTCVRLYETPQSLKKGEDIGAFRLGSTVVMLWTKELFSLSPANACRKVQLGEKLGAAAQRNA